MNIFHDRKNDRILVVQVGYPIVAWAAVFPFGVFFAGAGIYAWMEDGDFVSKLLVLICFASAAAFFWMTPWAATEIVATFDGKTRTLSIARKRPWGTSHEVVSFDDVFDVVTASFMLLDSRENRVDILLSGERRVRLRSTGAKEIENALVDVRALMRRPASLPPAAPT